MKLQLDFDNKTIRIEEKVNLSLLYDTLKRLLPQGEWKEFDIEAYNKFLWNDPIVIPSTPYVPYVPTIPTQPIVPNPYPWWINPVVTCDTPGNYSINYSVGTGSYNIDIR